MISPTRWAFAQKAEHAYQSKKAERARNDISSIKGIAKSKSSYVVELLSALDYEIREDMTAVEVGSGAHGLIWEFPSNRKTAVDPLANFYFENFKGLQDNGTTILEAKGEEIPLADAHADIILSENVLDHTHDPQQVLHEVKRILKPDGLFYFSVDINDLPWHVLGLIYNFIFKIGLHLKTRAFPAHPHHFRKNDVMKLFKRAGLRIEWQRVNGEKSQARSNKQKLIQLLGEGKIIEIIARPENG